jgi:hypothetical protein
LRNRLVTDELRVRGGNPPCQVETERLMRVVPIFITAVLVAAPLTGCSSDDNGSGNVALDTTGSRSVFDLEVGLCYNYPDNTTSVGEVPLTNCALAHDAEVFYIYDLPDYPAYNEDTVTTDGFDGCLDPFKAYVGVDYYATEAEDLGIYGLYPSSGTWANGDREVICSVVPLSVEDQLTGSMRGARG